MRSRRRSQPRARCAARDRPRPFYRVVFGCEILRAEQAELLGETDAVEFFPEAELPDLEPNRTTPEQVARLFELHRNPELPADFD